MVKKTSEQSSRVGGSSSHIDPQGWQFIWREFSTFQPNPSGWITMHNFFSKTLFFRSVQPQNDRLFIWSPIATRRFLFFPTKTPWMLFWFKNISRLWCKSTCRQHNLGQDAAFLGNPWAKIHQVSRGLTKILLTLGASNHAQISLCEKGRCEGKSSSWGNSKGKFQQSKPNSWNVGSSFFLGGRNFQSPAIHP